MKSIGIGAGALLLPRASTAELLAPNVEIARGTVRDADAAGHASGLPGVMVSNGRDVVVTDRQGHWQLPIRAGEAIFAIKPPHWKAAETSGSQSLCYLHEPYGTPAGLGGNGPAVASTGPLPSSIDFALMRSPEPERFEALLVADSQTYDRKELSYFDAVLMRTVARMKPAFAIHHGDVMADDLSLFPDYLKLIARTGFDWYHCPGNHDMNLDASLSEFAFAGWKRFLGPTRIAFQYAGATFVLLNNVAPTARADGTGIERYVGRIGEDQLAFVANVLEFTPRDSLVVVSMHVPLVSFETPDSRSDTTDDRARLLALLSGRPHNVSFSGHSHTTEHHYLGPEDGYLGPGRHHHHVLTAACGSWWGGPLGPDGVPVSVSRDGTPKGVHILSVDGNRYETRFVAFSDDEPVARIMRTENGSHLIVDVFDGGPRTEVACEFDDGSPAQIHLQRRTMCDPMVEAIFASGARLFKPWAKESPSSHIWTATLPIISSPLVVTVKDEYGRRHRLSVQETAGQRV